MDRAQDFPLILAKNRILQAIRDPESDNGPALKFLERRQRDRYSPKIIQEHAGELSVGYGELEGQPKATSPSDAKRMAESGERPCSTI